MFTYNARKSTAYTIQDYIYNICNIKCISLYILILCIYIYMTLIELNYTDILKPCSEITWDPLKPHQPVQFSRFCSTKPLNFRRTPSTPVPWPLGFRPGTKCHPPGRRTRSAWGPLVQTPTNARRWEWSPWLFGPWDFLEVGCLPFKSNAKFVSTNPPPPKKRSERASNY